MLSLLIAAILWGSSFPVISHSLRHISPFLFVVLRFTLAFLILIPVIRRRGRLPRLFARDLFVVSIPQALSFVLQYRAQELTTASKTALYVNSTPVWVVVLGWLFYREKFAPRQLVATVIALTGVVVTSTRLDFSGFGVINLGDVMSVGVGVCWALFILISKGVVKRLGGFELSWGLYFWTIVMTAPFLATEQTRFAWAGIPAVGYLAAFTTVVAYALYLKGVRSVSPLATSIIILVEVVVAFVISHFWLGESFSLIETAGVLLVVSGVVMVLKK